MNATRPLLVLGFALASSLAAPLLPIDTKARAQASCDVWSAYDEHDGRGSNLTAVACSSTPDDSSVVGLQCLGKRPQVRYYPGNGAQRTLPNKASLDVTFTVGDQSIPETMRYDAGDGVFSVSIGRNDPLLQLLQSGGPLDLASDQLDTHRFLAFGSDRGDRHGDEWLRHRTHYIGPPPPPPPDPDVTID